jgi:hypothetical protein
MASSEGASGERQEGDNMMPQSRDGARLRQLKCPWARDGATLQRQANGESALRAHGARPWAIFLCFYMLLSLLSFCFWVFTEGLEHEKVEQTHDLLDPMWSLNSKLSQHRPNVDDDISSEKIKRTNTHIMQT